MLDKAQFLFESYNNAIEGAYEDFFRQNKHQDILKLKEGKEQEFLKNSIEQWRVQEFKELDNQSPTQFIDTIGSIAEAQEVFCIGAKLCDKDLPDIFVNKLKYYGGEINKYLISVATNKSLIDSEEEVFISIMAIRLLGNWKSEEVVAPLLDYIYELKEESEIVVEEIVNALINIGRPTVESLIDILGVHESIGYIDEYILSALERIGKDNKSDAIYRCLKDVFLKMEDKIFGAMCLGDYGDGRAITALRGYLEKNKEKINKETYNEIKAAIKKLGGSITDL